MTKILLPDDDRHPDGTIFFLELPFVTIIPSEDSCNVYGYKSLEKETLNKIHTT